MPGPDLDSTNDATAPLTHRRGRSRRARGRHARKMHHRQMIRRALVVVVVLAILGVVTAISFPVYKQISTEWTLGGAGFRVNWDLELRKLDDRRSAARSISIGRFVPGSTPTIPTSSRFRGSAPGIVEAERM